MRRSEVRGAANAAKKNNQLDATAANDAIPAKQSLRDANAAMGTWMLYAQQ